MTRAMGLVYIVAACVFGCGEKLDPRPANDGVPTDGDAVEDASLAFIQGHHCRHNVRLTGDKELQTQIEGSYREHIDGKGAIGERGEEGTVQRRGAGCRGLRCDAIERWLPGDQDRAEEAEHARPDE